MTKGSTFLLKGVIIAIGLLALAFCTLILPRVILAELSGDFDYAPLLIGLYVPAIPFFYALSQAFKILGNIDRNQAFSLSSVKALKHIKISSLTISGIFALSMPYIFWLADRDDAPGLAALGFVIIGASFVVATAAAVFQSLLQHAVDMKSENDLTV